MQILISETQDWIFDLNDIPTYLSTDMVSLIVFSFIIQILCLSETLVNVVFDNFNHEHVDFHKL